MRRGILITLILALTAAAVSAAQTEAGNPAPDRQRQMEPQDRCCGCRKHGPEGFLKGLDLSAAQEKKIGEIVRSEREKSAPLREKVAETGKLLWQAETADRFDEAAVRKLAAEQARLMTELTVARARAHSSIHALLTPEQKKAVEKLPPPRGRRGRLPPGGDCGGPDLPGPPPGAVFDDMPEGSPM